MPKASPQVVALDLPPPAGGGRRGVAATGAVDRNNMRQSAFDAERTPTLPSPASGGGTSMRIAGQDWPLAVRRNARARRISLRVAAPSSKSALPQIILTLPMRASLPQAMKFAETQRVWLARQLSRHEPLETAQDGLTLEVLGAPLIFCHSGQLRGLARREGNKVWISGEPSRFGARVADYIARAMEAFTRTEVAAMTPKLQVRAQRIRIKEMQARWGSCSAKGDLVLNWRLALAPVEIARYVVAHEVAHLRHMDHSPKFWAAVAELMPHAERHRAWLRMHGQSLYKQQF